MSRRATPATEAIRGMRDVLFTHATDYDAARREFAWPDLTAFNFALEWFDVVAGENPDRPAVQIVEADLSLRSWTYGELSARSDQVAAWLRSLGIGRGDHVIVMLNNTIELWEVMLAITKLGAVSIPTSTLLSASDLAYRIEHGRAGAVVTLGALADRLEGIDPAVLRIGVGASLPADWKRFTDADA
ncbi:AMP-binding protein, partial [Microbacterium sp. RD12]